MALAGIFAVAWLMVSRIEYPKPKGQLAAIVLGWIMINVACFYEGEDDKPVRQAWVDETGARIRAAGGATDACAYVNFVNDEGPERVHDIYPDATYERLQDVKRRYDPTNLFRLNQNVQPA